MVEYEKKMKLGTITRKNLLCISLFTLFLIVMCMVIIPVSAGVAVISAPIIFDTGKTAGSTLSVDISVEDVERLFAYEFRLYYDATVLTVASVSSYDPFTLPLVTPIVNNVEGWVYVAYSMPMGETEGFSTVDPEPIVAIGFWRQYARIFLSGTQGSEIHRTCPKSDSLHCG